MKARFLLLVLFLSLDTLLPRVKADDPVCTQDSDCDCTGVICSEGADPVAACCSRPGIPTYCECNCNSVEQPNCTS